ncbi:hypothetical protein EDD86DRAFT_193613 [Gorgonomyces haynaldii]|nr:hypothetical protein EDD86DRAFT_193613 [Gorgonomyces haynaldii]
MPTSARYQPLQVDAEPRRRNPFYCAGCFGVLSSWLSAIAGPVLPTRQQVTGYTSGFLFALGWWIFIDACAFNGYLLGQGTKDVLTLSFEDWVPGIVSTLSLVIVNMIDRETLGADDFQYESSSVAWKARACAFFGITLALGALGGALAILSLKYIIPGRQGDAFYLGQGITVQNFLIFASSMVLWFGRNSSDDPLA